MLLPKIIGYFKMNTAKRANQMRLMPGTPLWQRDYFEHVIRDEIDLQRIRTYIAGNPVKWGLDETRPGKGGS
jgi:REP element-mobilizing transposase RayT